MRNLRYLSIALLVAGCPQPSKLVLPNPPVIDRFTAAPTTVMRGGTVTLEWSTADATEVEIIQVGVGEVVGVGGKASGSTSVVVNDQSLFVLNAANSRGVKTTALATVAVEGAAQQIMFAALPGVVTAGGSTTLVWNTPGARAVSITPAGGASLDLRGQVQTGSVEVVPTGPTRYTLTADGTSKTVDVAVTQAITSFTASKSLADAGEQVTLSWQTTNATKVTVAQPGRGTLFTSADGGMMQSSGSVMDAVPGYAAGTVVPYQLTVEGAGPPVTQTASIVVGNAPAITAFRGPEYAKLGGKFRLTWTTLNADAIELSMGTTVFYRSLSSAEALSGFLELDTPATETAYTLIALNTRADVRVTRSWTQKVVGAVAVTSFTATPGTVAAGGDAVTLSWNVPGARHLVVTDGRGHTVASARGPAAEMGMSTAYPNGPTTYELVADNTIDPVVRATAPVTVTSPAAFGASGTLLTGDTADVTWSVGSGGLIGYPGGTAVVLAASTGFVDISTTGTKLVFPSSDDATSTFTPADFETFLWGGRVTGPVTASTNGFVVFGPSAGPRGTTTALPNSTVEVNFLAPWWADLAIPATGGVYWEVLNEAPERTLVVQWNHVTANAAVGSDLVFQLKVHQTGKVTFEYRTLAGTVTVMPVIGVQGAANTALLGPVPTAGSSTTFFGGVPSPLSITFTGPQVISGFIKVGSGYLRVRFAANVVRVGEVFISEALYTPNPAVVAEGEWIEISNRSQSPIDLAGWTVDLSDGGSFLIDAGLPLPSGGSVLLGQILRDAGNDDVNTVFAYGPLWLPDTAASISVGRGAFRYTSSYTPALAGSDAGVSVNIDNQPYLVSTDTTSTAPHGINCTSKTPIGTQIPQQHATPGVFQPCGMPFKMSSIAPSYFDVSGTGVPLFASFSNRDDSITSVDISSAPFSFSGAPVTTLFVSTNGWIVLKPYTGTSNLTNKTLPSTTQPSGSTLAIFWDDLDTNTSGITNDVYSRRVAPGADPLNPGGHWIFQWHHWSHNSNQTDDYNFQIKLFDTGVIEYHYAEMISRTSSNLGEGGGATVWLDSLDGGTALISSINQPTVRPNTALRFTP